MQPLANTKIDKFFCKIVTLNILALWKSKEVIANATGATDYSNHHKVVETYHNMMFIVDLLMSKKTFEEKPSRSSGDNPKNTHIDLFGRGITAIALEVPLQNYIEHARGNWKNTKVAGIGEEEG